MVARRPQVKLLIERSSLRTKLIIAAALVLFGAEVAYLLANTPQWRIFISDARYASMSTFIWQIPSYRFRELGELVVNFPMTKMPAKLHAVLPYMGVLLFLLVFFGLATKRRAIGPTEVYLVCYTGIMFVWPYYDARFWLPVIPLLIAYSVLAFEKLGFPKSLIATYCVVFATLGFAVIIYSTRISFAGSKFPDRYGDGNLRPTYCVALKACQGAFDHTKVDAKSLRLLQQYH